MPKVDGISLISYIREMSRKLPIIVFTGVGYDEDRMHAALRAGANGYVSKNLPIEQLYCVLSRVLATCQQRARREALTSRAQLSRARWRGVSRRPRDFQLPARFRAVRAVLRPKYIPRRTPTGLLLQKSLVATSSR